jgi:hypothetical protein
MNNKKSKLVTFYGHSMRVPADWQLPTGPAGLAYSSRRELTQASIIMTGLLLGMLAFILQLPSLAQ